MSSRVVNSRFARTRGGRSGRHRDRDDKPAPTVLPQAEVVAPPVEEPPEPEPDPFTLKHGFIRLNGRVTVIEVDEEIWGNKRYYVAALSEDPSVCIKALTISEAVGNLIRHLMRSPTIRRFYMPEAPAPTSRVMRLTGIALYR